MRCSPLVLALALCVASCAPTDSRDATAVLPTPASATTPIPLSLSELPNADILYQPGDLPDGIAVSAVNNSVLLERPLSIQAPDRIVQRSFVSANHPDWYGNITLYTYQDAKLTDQLYYWLAGNRTLWSNAGDSTVMISANSFWTADVTAFIVCKSVGVVQVPERALQLQYAKKVAQRIRANGCDGLGDSYQRVIETPTPPDLAVSTTSISATMLQPQPDPEGYTSIRAYTFADLRHGWLALGATIYATSDGGKTWQIQYTTDSMVKSITFVSATHGWIETTHGYVLTEDGGHSWHHVANKPSDGRKRVPIPKLIDHTYPFCPSLNPGPFFSINARTAWAYCESIPEDYFASRQLHQTNDGGKTWHLIKQQAPYGRYGLDNVFFLDERHGWVTPNGGQMASTSDGGKTWAYLELPSERAKEPLTSDDTRAALFLTPKDGFVLSPTANPSYELLATNDAGKTWRSLFLAPQPTIRPGGLFALVAPDRGVGVNDTQLFHTNNLGHTTTWTLMADLSFACSERYAPITALSFPDTRHGWALIHCVQPDRILLYHTEDGGVSWTQMDMVRLQRGLTANVKDSLAISISFVNTRTGYLVTKDGLLWRSDDGGKTFGIVDHRSIHTSSTRFVTAKVGWELRGSQLFTTADGGLTWRGIALGTPIRLFAALPDGHVWALSGDRLAPKDATQPPLQLLRSQDGGRSWQVAAIGAFPGSYDHPWPDLIQFADAQRGWLRSGDGLWFTDDGGHTWAQLY